MKKKRKIKAKKDVQSTGAATAVLTAMPAQTASAETAFEMFSPAPESDAAPLPEEVPAENSGKVSLWLAGALAVGVSALLLRFAWLTLKPFHHDEGVNGFFLTTLFRDGVYKYDPSNYHGPSLYYFALLSSYIFGLNDFAVRFVTAAFGVLTVALVFSLRRYLGTIGTLVAAALIALSPGLTFFSRYFIHEILLVFFTFAVVVCVLKFIEGARPGKITVAVMAITLFVCALPVALQAAALFGSENQVVRLVARLMFAALGIAAVYFVARRLMAWNEGRSIYLLLASASAVMAFATKETAFISLGTMAIAVVCVAVWRRANSGVSGAITEPNELSYRTFSRRLSNIENPSTLIFLCLVLFAFLGIVFFSSFFTYEQGIGAAFEAYSIWSKTGSKDHTQSGLLGYIKWILAIEAPVLILGAIGAFIAFRKSNNSFAMFVALWAFGLLAAYSIIPYKTPWLAINFVLPMALIGGYGVNELAAGYQSWKHTAAKLLTAFALAISAYQAIELNFFRYDDERRPYVYVHSLRSMTALVEEIERISERAGTKRQASIIITSPENWPLPWTLHDYKNAGFYGQMVQMPNSEMVLGSKAQSAELEEKYSATHQLMGNYVLRPGVELLLYVRKDLAQK